MKTCERSQVLKQNKADISSVIRLALLRLFRGIQKRYSSWFGCTRVTEANVITLKILLGAGQPICFCVLVVFVFVRHPSTAVLHILAD